MSGKTLLKDEVMYNLVQRGINVAQFISFGPDGKQRFCCVRGVPGDKVFTWLDEALSAVGQSGSTEAINVRTFRPDKPDGNPFHPGLVSGPIGVAKVTDLIAQGYHVIINEFIDPSDGGFSGVALGDLVEFAACDIPRCVDKEEDVPCAALSRSLARRMVRKVYGFNLSFPFPSTWRVEFSVHPGPVGYFGEKAVFWQAEEMSTETLRGSPAPSWPNRYSTFMGDKAFGLLMADLHDFPVPRTKVFGRVIPPFEFGLRVHSGEGDWIRTCPQVQEPGLYTTQRGYLDPFALMQQEDADGSRIASIIIQQGIKPGYSGAVITDSAGKMVVDGLQGRGDKLMAGNLPPADRLPADVMSSVRSLWWELTRTFGTVRFEWVYDGQRKQIWILQLHGGGSPSLGDVIVPGDAPAWRDFHWAKNLEEFRAFSRQAKADGAGVRLIGNIGMTSHPADILRRLGLQSRLCRRD